VYNRPKPRGKGRRGGNKRKIKGVSSREKTKIQKTTRDKRKPKHKTIQVHQLRRRDRRRKEKKKGGVFRGGHDRCTKKVDRRALRRKSLNEQKESKENLRKLEGGAASGKSRRGRSKGKDDQIEWWEKTLRPKKAKRGGKRGNRHGKQKGKK